LRRLRPGSGSPTRRAVQRSGHESGNFARPTRTVQPRCHRKERAHRLTHFPPQNISVV
jgi:hypothetical protein